MKKILNIGNPDIKKLVSVAGFVTVVFIGFYATGLYRNILQIKKLKKEQNNQ